jgi:methionyl-tRNA formyltransferase
MHDVLLIGMGVTTLTALESLLDTCHVVGVVRRTETHSPDPVVTLAKREGIPVFADTTIPAIDALVDRLSPACVVVSSYDRILPAATLGRTQFVNVHYSPLPRYRGRANVNWAILNGDSHTAISIHVLEPDLDSGRLLFQQQVAIGPEDSAGSLYARLNQLQRENLGTVVARFIEGDRGAPQVGLPTYGCTRLPMDGEIDWRQSTGGIDALIRALDPPFPGAFTYLDGEPLTIWRAKPVTDAPVYEGRIPGRIVFVSRAEGYVDVLTGDGVLRLLSVQGPGGPSAPASVIRSVKATLGLTTADLLKRIRAIEGELAAARAELLRVTT